MSPIGNIHQYLCKDFELFVLDFALFILQKPYLGYKYIKSWRRVLLVKCVLQKLITWKANAFVQVRNQSLSCKVL